MSWFTKKKDSDKKKKQTSIIAIETMSEDMENTLKNSESKNSKVTNNKKSLKKSPFLLEKSDKSDKTKENLETKKEVKDKEKTTPKPISITEEKIQSENTHKNPITDIKQSDTKEGKKPLTSEAPTAKKTEEDKMEEIVKAVDPAISKKTKTIFTSKAPMPKVENITKIEKDPLTNKLEKRKTGVSIFSELKKKKSAVQPPTKSPFGVPTKGIDVKKKIELEKETSSQKKFNKPLLILAIVVFVLSLATGGYSYYRKSIQLAPVEISTQPMTTKENSTVPEYKSDNFADSAIVLQTSKETLISDLKEYIKKEKTVDSNKFIDGQFIRPLQNETEYITGKEILQIFKSQDATLNGFLDKPAVIFVTEEKVEALKNQEINKDILPVVDSSVSEKAIRLSLVLEIKEGNNQEDVVERLTEIETIFPGTLKNLMIEEDITIPSDKIVFQQASSQKEGLVNVVRYFNFTVDDITRSIEWGSLLYKNKSYIFFTTSKAATESLIKALY